MKVKFHLCSPSANCGHCEHMKSIPARGSQEDMDQFKVDYCYIVCSRVEPDYYCSFYKIKPKPKTDETKTKTVLPPK